MNGHTSSDDVSAPADSIEHVYKDVVNRVRCVVMCAYVCVCMCVYVYVCMCAHV